MREKPKDINRLSHIIEAIDNLFEVTKGISFDGYKGNKTLRLPLSNEFKEKHPEVEWKVIIGMRHVLVHDYYQISDEMVWATIQTELLPLKEKVELYKRKLE